MSSAQRRPDPPANESPRFEDALAELEKIARDLEDGQLGLEEALVRYECGVKLLRQCHELLGQAERRIELLAGVDADGNPIVQPFEIVDVRAEATLTKSALETEGTGSKAPRASDAPASRGEPPPKPSARRNDERPERPARPRRASGDDDSRGLF